MGLLNYKHIFSQSRERQENNGGWCLMKPQQGEPKHKVAVIIVVTRFWYSVESAITPKKYFTRYSLEPSCIRYYASYKCSYWMLDVGLLYFQPGWKHIVDTFDSPVSKIEVRNKRVLYFIGDFRKSELLWGIRRLNKITKHSQNQV